MGINHVGVVSEVDTQMLVQQWNQTDATFPPKQGRERERESSAPSLNASLPCFSSPPPPLVVVVPPRRALSGIHELFEANADKAPQQVAVVGPSHDKSDEKVYELSYGDVEARANRLARYLAQHAGVVPGSIVGVLLERSTTFYVAMLAILKAGGAYVSIDPEYPDDRIEYMLQVPPPPTTMPADSEHPLRLTAGRWWWCGGVCAGLCGAGLDHDQGAGRPSAAPAGADLRARGRAGRGRRRGGHEQ